METISSLSDNESLNEDLLVFSHNSFDVTCVNLDSIEPLCPVPQVTKAGASSNLKKTRSRSEFEKSTLSLFLDKNNKNPKKEYLRCQIIRGVKRAMRDAKNPSKRPAKKLHSIDSQCSESIAAWEDFSFAVRINQNFVSSFSSTLSGPLTDGKSSRKYESNEKSFNDRFCCKFFSDIMKTDLYSKFLSLVFTPFTCKSLCSKFNFRPVSHSQKSCSSDCRLKWEKLKEYVSLKMIEDLRHQKIEVP